MPNHRTVVTPEKLVISNGQQYLPVIHKPGSAVLPLKQSLITASNLCFLTRPAHRQKRGLVKSPLSTSHIPGDVD